LRAFRARDDGESAAAVHAAFDEVADDIEVEWNFGDENDIGAGCDACVEGDPAGVSAHEFADHDAVVAHGGGVESIEGVGGGGERGGEAEGDVGADDVVVDGFGDADTVDSRVNKRRSAA